VDALLEQAVAATTRPELVARLRALDRVLRHGHYVVPQYFANTLRVGYRNGKFERPAVKPDYFRAEDWVLRTWWRKQQGG
jgi:microcin C transport system substrate-binding protein